MNLLKEITTFVNFYIPINGTGKQIVYNMAPAKKAETIANTPFPPYALCMVGEHHILVGGGGGQAKTGVPNAFIIYELTQKDGECQLEKVLQHSTDSAACMNLAISSGKREHILAVGLDDSCQLHILRYKVIRKRRDSTPDSEGLRKRKGNLTRSEDHGIAPKLVTFQVEVGPKVQTDFQKNGGFQKAVAFNKDNSLIATGGTDGVIRVWQAELLTKKLEIKAHSDDIDDIACHPLKNQVVSASRDSHATVWNIENGEKVIELIWKKKTSEKYRMRHCRFGRVVDKESEVNLYTTHIPVVRGRNPQPSYIAKWDSKSYKPTLIKSMNTDIVSSFAVSDDGIYIGAGYMTGAVGVFISFSLQQLYHVSNAHNIFVTGLQFTPSTKASRAIMGNNDFSLLSVAADNSLKLHQVAERATWHFAWVIIGMVFLIYLAFWTIATMGL